MSPNLEGPSALITGAASGIGLAVAEKLAAQGAKRLVLVDRDRAALARVQLRCEVARASGDVADETFWDGLMPSLSGLRYAVVNAGVSGAAPIRDLTFSEWRRILSVNLDGAFLTLRAVLRAMEGPGAIVVTASASGVKAEPGVAAYGASKAGVLQLARVAAKEAAPRGIRVNAIAPGGVTTPIWDDVPFFQDLVTKTGDRERAFAEMGKVATPLGRYASAEEIAGQIAFLLSDASAFVTGATLVSDGGYTL